MENNGKLKEINIKSRTCCYFDDILKTEDFNFGNVLIDEKSYKNVLVYNIPYKILIGAIPLCVKFDKVEGFIRVYDGTRNSILFCPEKHVIFTGLDIL